MSEFAIQALIESTKVSKVVKEKLLNLGKNRDKQFKSLEADILKLKTDHERKTNELEKKFADTAKMHEEERSKNSKSNANYQHLCDKVSSLEEKCESLDHELEKSNKDRDQLKRDQSQWEDQKLNFKHLMDKKDTENKYLTDEWNSTTKRLNEIKEQTTELQVKYETMNSNQANLNFKMKRVEEERDFARNHNSDLSVELSQKSAQLSDALRTKKTEISTLNTKLGIEVEENKKWLETIENMKENINQLNKQNEKLQQEMTKNTEDYNELERILQSDLLTKNKLIDLYQKTAEDSGEEVERLKSAVHEMKAAVLPISEANHQLEKDLKLEKAKNEEVNIEKLKLVKELEAANDLLESRKQLQLSEEEIARLHPTAAMTSKFMKSGLTLTQVN